MVALLHCFDGKIFFNHSLKICKSIFFTCKGCEFCKSIDLWHTRSDSLHLAKEKVLTAAEVAIATKELKSGKAAGEDEIRPEMLKALTG